MPNLTGPVDRLGERLDDLRDAGVRAAMVAPLLLGLDTVRSLATSAGIALIGHPAFAGSLVAPRQGLAPELLFGDLFRIAGCDVVIYPNAGGRFPFTLGDCQAIQGRLLAPLGGLRPAFAMVAGGIDAAKLERWLPEYAVDTIFLARRESPRQAGPRRRGVGVERARGGPGPPQEAKMKSASKVLAARDFRWPVALKPYKDGGELYRDVTRQTLLGEGEGEEALSFVTRYFEVAAGGFSTLEHHQHPHAVVVLRGRGTVQLGDRPLRHRAVRLRLRGAAARSTSSAPTRARRSASSASSIASATGRCRFRRARRGPGDAQGPPVRAGPIPSPVR